MIKNFSARIMVTALISIINTAMYTLVFLPVFKPGNENFYLKISPWIFVLSCMIVFAIQLPLIMLNRKLDKVSPWIQSPLKRSLIQVSLSTLICLAICLCIRITFVYIIFKLPLDLKFEILHNIFVTSVILICVMVDVGYHLVQHWKMSLIELEKSQREFVQMQLELLKNQVNPHFLFNSLSILSSLVYQDPDEAAEFIVQLARVYRNILDIHDKEMIELNEELKILEPYMYLLNKRYRNALDIHLNINQESMHCFLPSMTLQLLIENAIKHNIISANKVLKIIIESRGDSDLVVTNNLQLRNSPIESTGTGLKNIKQRYRMTHKKSIEVIKNDLTFSVIIPLLKTDEGSIYLS